MCWNEFFSLALFWSILPIILTNTQLDSWILYNFDEMNKFSEDNHWCSGSPGLESQCSFWSYKMRTKDNISFKQASWFHVCLRQTKCSLLIYSWIVKAKAIKAKTIFVVLFFYSSVDPWYPKVIWFAINDVKKSYLNLWFWQLSTVLTLWAPVLKIKPFPWQRFETVLQRQVNWIPVISFHLSDIAKAVKVKE